MRAARPPRARTLRQTATGRLRIDRARIAAEQRLDGKFLLSTSDPDLSAEDVALGYRNLLEAERGFRHLKTTLELRPVFHRLEHRMTTADTGAGRVRGVFEQHDAIPVGKAVERRELAGMCPVRNRHDRRGPWGDRRLDGRG